MATTNGAATKNAAISAAILMKLAEGASMKDAVDGVLGAGWFDRIVGDLYDALRAKAGEA